jgi:thiamine phosphate synthase YjbQ (UPF0047 family)
MSTPEVTEKPASSPTVSPKLITDYKELKVPTLKGIHLTDISKDIQDVITETGLKDGIISVISRHTTTSITINEMEGRLVDDIRQYLLKLAPPDYPYLHNDLHLRDGPPDWPGGNEAWRAQEPINAHSHLLNLVLGSSESIPVKDGKLMIGTWQSVIMVELDGPRTRTVGVQVVGSS